MKKAPQDVSRCTHNDNLSGSNSSAEVTKEVAAQNAIATQAEATGIEEVVDDRELIEGMSKQDTSFDRKLYLLARFCQDGRAAEKLWNRSSRSTQWLTAALLECPELFAEALQRSTEVPIILSLTPTSAHYHKKLTEHLRKHRLGARSGLSADNKSRWGGKGNPAGLAYLAFTTIQILRGYTSTDGYAIALALLIRAKHKIERPAKRAKNRVRIIRRKDTLLDRVKKLPDFGQNSVEQWCDLCVVILDATVVPGLRPGKQGRRKKNGDAGGCTDGDKKPLRDQIRARIREMVARPDKGHSNLRKIASS